MKDFNNNTKYKFKFSIIITIHNSENYLEKAINSIINQNLDFETNTQIILIDDGSIDNSGNICKEFQEIYPNNILFLQQEQKGVSLSRNLGLKYAEGEYINFLDSDDYLSNDTLLEVSNFFNENFNLTDVVAIPIFNFEKNKKQDELNYKFSEDRVINLILEPNCPQISISSTFIKTEALKNLEFNENLIYSEDTLLINEILLNKKTLGVLSKPKYYFRKRNKLTAVSDIIIFNKKYYINRLKHFHLNLLNKAEENNEKVFNNRYKILENYFSNLDIKKILKKQELNHHIHNINSNEINEITKIEESIYLYKKLYNIDENYSNDKNNTKYPNFIEKSNKINEEIIKDDFYLKKSDINKFIQFTIVYDLIQMLKIEELPFDDENEENEFRNLLNEVMSYIDIDVIINNKNIKNNFLTNYLIFLKNQNLEIEIKKFSEYKKELKDINNQILSKSFNNFYNSKYKNNKTNDFSLCILKIEDYVIDCLNNHNIWLKKIDLNEEYLTIAGFLNTSFNPNTISIDIIKEKDNFKEIIFSKHLESESKRQKIILSTIWEDNYNFEIKIPIEDILDSKLNIVANYYIDGDKSNKSQSNLISSYSPIKFSNKSKFKKTLFNNENMLQFKDNSFFISDYFKFSIVMAIYNTGKYLNEAIDSIINQTLDFKENVQLILVDDGSQDNSKDICLKYKEEYPENILVISQKNSGQAHARNNGIKYVKGKYVNFLDSDDKLSLNTLEESFKFFEKHYDEIDFLAIPMKFFGRKDDPHMLNDKFNKSRVIDLEKEPNNPQFATASAFVKYDVLDEFKFSTNVSFSEDAIAVNRLLLNRKKYGVINTANYYYRKREDLSSTIDNVSQDKSYFTDKLKYYYMELIGYCLSKENKVPKFIQYTLAYDLQWMLKQPSLELLDSKIEKDEFWFYLKEVIKYLDDEVILKNKYVTDNIFIPYFYYLKKDNLNREYHGKHDVSLKINNYKYDSLRNHNIWIDIVSIKNNVLTIAGFFNSDFDIDHVSFQAVKEEKSGKLDYFQGRYVKYTSRKDITYLDTIWQFKHNFEIKIPISEKEESKIWIKTFYHKDGDKSNFDTDNTISAYLNIGFSKHARLSKISNYLIKDKHMVIFEDNTFFIWPYSFKSMLKREHNVRKFIKESDNEFSKEALRLRLVYMILHPFFRFFNRNKEIWLFMDRPDVADDNAMHLFKYANSQKDNIKKYYIMEKDCKDYKPMSKIGKILNYKSFKEKLYYLFANKVISTHPYESVINPFFEFGKDERELYSGLMTSEIYFLQHGVTKDNISSWLTKYDKNFSLIVTVSEEERESFFDEGYAFDENVVQVLGFPRYDNLKNDSPKKEILIIPTWRKYLRGNKAAFLNSDYFKSLNSMLNSEELINFCENYGYTIVFKPHPELDMYIEDTDERYRDLLNINEKIELSTKRTYQELFNDASILITDYSSVFFDFAYMKKPVIYYHPNDDYHYGESYFDYETMGFGDVIKNEENLVEKIKEYIENECVMEENYKKRVDKFFKFTDKNNCKRVYDWIKKN